MKLVSFAVPCYNSENYMRHCVDTLLTGGDKIEIILVNDGSTDQTGAIADEYKEKYPDIIKVVHKENGGHGSGIMAGLKEAEGLYYKVVDSDDWADPEALQKILQVIEELLLGMKDVHEAGIIHRDLHLGNILIKEGHVVLSDFGLSKDTMINHSLKSTSTPKNSHYFIDPIGLHDFTALDKLSDIYSIGKIIDYITGESQLNKKLSFVISKATERNRAKRYTTMDEMIQDVNSSVREISEEEKLQNIEVNLQHGEISKDVEEFVMRLMRQEQLSNYIVRKQLYTFWKVLIQFNEIDQLALLGEIDRTYSEATGYGHFENYDLFAGIAYNVIRNSANMKIQRKAYSILEGCASYRYNASDYLKEINIYYPNILSQE